jgi:hypothetical protein
VDEYIDEVKVQKGKKITRKMIYESAGYKDPTEFQRWQRNDPKTNNAAARAIERVLEEKQHLK